MNRENKRKTFEKGYYKTHACNDTFTCKVCGRVCTPQNAGSDHRNHCPNCLSSLHVDEEPGDRASDCGGIMEPVAVWVRKGGEWAIIHRCKRCGKLSSNRVAADDNPMKLMSIAMKPLCAPPFPLDYIEEMTALMGGDGGCDKPQPKTKRPLCRRSSLRHSGLFAAYPPDFYNLPHPSWNNRAFCAIFFAGKGVRT